MGQITSLFAHKMVAAGGPDIDARALLAQAGVDHGEPWDPKLMISDTAYYELLEGIAAQVDPTALPLRGGALMRCDDYGALGLAWKAAPTLMGSFLRVERFARLWTTVVEYQVHTTARGAMFELHRAGPRRLGMRLSNEATLASAVAISREVCPVPFKPISVHFSHRAPATLDHHEAYFGCPVRFDAEFDGMEVASEALDQANILGDEGITQFLLSHLEAELCEVATEETLEGLTKEAVARALSEGRPRMADIARGLGMSARSYHRRLSEHGLSFQTLTEVTQRELAEGLLRDERYSLAEIAFLTGFSEQSSFTRAFKRWVGHTPAHYRRDRL